MLRELAVSLLFTTPALAVDFANLGVLSGDATSWVGGINANGSVVVGTSSRSDGFTQAFRWTRSGGMKGIGFGGFPNGSGTATGVSADGSVVVGTASVNGYRNAARWSQSSGVQLLGVLAGANFSDATGVSGDGNTVVGSSGVVAGGYLAGFEWKYASGQMTPLGVQSVMAVSLDSSTVVGYSTDSRAYRATASGTEVLLTPNGDAALGGGVGSYATAVNASGNVVVGVSSNQAFRWSPSTLMVGLGFLSGATRSESCATNWDGSIVVGTSSNRAFLWTQAAGMVDLHSYLSGLGVDLTGWNLEIARAISADGTAIAGWGTFNGETRAFVVNGLAIPAPGVSLVLFGFGVLSRRRRG